jgi:hypothetical protein
MIEDEMCASITRVYILHTAARVEVRATIIVCPKVS